MVGWFDRVGWLNFAGWSMGTSGDSPGDSPSGWTPLDLSPLFWWDASDLNYLFQDTAGATPVTADGDVIGLIEDKTGNGNNLTQATTSLKLVYKTNGTLHWFLADGTDDRIHGTTSAALPAPSTYGVAFKLDTVGSSECIIEITGSGVNSISESSNNFIMYAGSSSIIAAESTAAAHALIAKFNGASSAANYDGVTTSENPGTQAPATAAAISFMGRATAGTTWNGKIYQMLGLDRALTAPEEAALLAYLQGKAGL